MGKTTSNSGHAMTVFTTLACVVFILALGLYLNGRMVTAELAAVASNISQAVGFLLVASGVYSAAFALNQTRRANDPKLIAARKWIEKRNQLIAEIEFALFSSPQVLSNLENPFPDAPQETYKNALAIMGSIRRLRAGLDGFAATGGFVFINAESRKKSHKGRDTFDPFMQALAEPPPVIPVDFLKYNYPWLFNGDQQSPRIILSLNTLMAAYAEAMIALDYLDVRIPTFLQKLDEAHSSAAQDSKERQQILTEELKDIYCHLVIIRACMEAEWARLFSGKKVSASRIEDRISDLLFQTTDTPFLAPPGPSRGNAENDNFSGYRFGASLTRLKKHKVFEDDPGLSANAPFSAETPRDPIGRIKRLYDSVPKNEER